MKKLINLLVVIALMFTFMAMPVMAEGTAPVTEAVETPLEEVVVEEVVVEETTAGMMRAYMACRCTADFPLERKISRFLTMSLSVFRVPEDERAQIIAHVATLDVRALARRVMNALFESLSMEFEL